MNTNPYFKTQDYKDGLCQLNFATDGSNTIDLLMPDTVWKLLDSQTGKITSVDISKNPIGLGINFVDGNKYNPYTVSIKPTATNLVSEHLSLEGLDRIIQNKHKLRIYTELSDTPVAEFEGVKALHLDFEVTKMHKDKAW